MQHMSVNQLYILFKKYYILMSMITECQNEVKTTLTLFIWILCYYINKKQIMFMQMLQIMLENDLTPQIMVNKGE